MFVYFFHCFQISFSIKMYMWTLDLIDSYLYISSYLAILKEQTPLKSDIQLDSSKLCMSILVWVMLMTHSCTFQFSPVIYNKLVNCINDTDSWISRNYLQLNTDNTKTWCKVRDIIFLLTWLLGGWIQHVPLIILSTTHINWKYYKPKAFKSKSESEKLVHAFISSRLD